MTSASRPHVCGSWHRSVFRYSDTSSAGYFSLSGAAAGPSFAGAGVIVFHNRAGVSVVSVITWYSSRMMRTPVTIARRLIVLAALLVPAAAYLAAQSGAVHPVSGRRFADVMDASGAAWLDRSERDIE